ncbi:hypothetical protein ABNQ39_15130 [Azospirillum sp. A26]|uniref:hypothetical protein n=1 Tax=Azospirillum sp. A26 TaxID=3160607 RepID=UPI00366BB8AF
MASSLRRASAIAKSPTEEMVMKPGRYRGDFAIWTHAQQNHGQWISRTVRPITV